MSLFSDPADLNAHGRNVAQLLLVGGIHLERLAKGRERVSFKPWAEAVRDDASKRGLTLPDDQAAWLWEALLAEPRVNRELGSRVISRDEEWRKQEPILVLNPGCTLGVFLKPFSSIGRKALPLSAEAKPDALITLRGALTMVPGKASSRRFECSDVACLVEFDVDKPGTPEREVVLLKLEPGDVTVAGRHVIACARSLNHAFTVTSRRLEPHRRGDGGRAYDHLALRRGGRWILLEDIRCAVEAGTWELA